MGYGIEGTGTGADIDKAKEAFKALVQALDAATDTDRNDGGDVPTLFTGSLTGGAVGGSWSLTADEVRSKAASKKEK